MNAPNLAFPELEVPDTLARILADKYEEVRQRAEVQPQSELERAARDVPPPRGFIRALCSAVADGRVGLIAEIKRASPSGGLIRDPFDPPALAEAYAEGGATCLSVLTDAPYFQGRPEDLKAARAACELPVLRKDFMVHPWQIYESRAMGADCVLLIMAALADTQAKELEDLAHSLDMAVLVEVHDERELERALGLNSRLIGINNRNLKTLKTDIATTEKLAPLVPADRIPVAESGIRTPEDVRRMAVAGARCILVGEHLMRQQDVTAAASALVHAL
ncbi:indole-3-glycerol phosphate synthase TrpC [Siccirubricoccus sp. KC 17139]|uniref:Indole-3-glycerol phosphate synthase n=1 Tax=Siccirubricoccus soli TaxID=2899147 RepID=A0ABT1D4B5_9PROT|nr:indole-3-glycerol phosphate synthase TrpC [Siccirubricoccus soli]MCO6416769.1 indole-3-glycerol phosphate synthase TrpC [Siccirubricoccus soli]MCP2682904.1 indole-3-glycerol phosphate synthase TrpC [Siccirubricoccus soli]